MPSTKQFFITLGDINFLLDQMRDAIKIVGFDAAGNAIYGFVDANGVTQTLGLFGQFMQNGQPVGPLEVIDPVTGLSIYDGAREASGFRVPSGFFNNLVDMTRWTWGGTADPFPRLTQADYDNYVQQVLTNPALTSYAASHPSYVPVADNSAAYADLNKTVVDYTPRMITQTISSSYGAPNAPAAVGIAAVSGGAAQSAMSPGELLIVELKGTQLAFQFSIGIPPLSQQAPGVTYVDVTYGKTIADALAVIQAKLQTVDPLATAGVDNGHIAIALGSPTDGDLVIFDYAGLGLGGDFAPSVDASNSALIRTGAYTDVFVSENVITATDSQGAATAHGTITEYSARNLNTLPGDPSTSGVFTLFGQFFDHGLDFIDKGGQGAKIIIPLAPNDPLYRAPGTGGPSDPGNTTITITRATPDGYTVTDLHGRPVSIAGTDNTWGTSDDLSAPGADGVYGTADDVHAPVAKPAGPTTYTNHTSPYIDQSQSYGSITQTTSILREWVLDPNTGQYRPGAELLDGHRTVAYHSTTFNDSSSNGLNATGELANGVTTKTVPTLAELREHMRETGRDDLTWDDVNNLRERDASGHVIDTNGNAAGGYLFTGEALVLDMNPRFDAATLLFDDNDGSTVWDAVARGKVNAAIDYMNAHMADVGRGGDVLSFANGQLQLVLGSMLSMGPGQPPIPSGTTLTGAYAMAPWVNFANFSIIVDSTAPGGQGFYNAVGEIMMASIGDHYVAGDGRANENFGLTSLHHVFHENHNVQLVNLETNILAQADQEHRNAYQLAVASKPGDVVAQGISVVSGHYVDANGNFTLADGTVSWDPDKMFEATKLINEMEYQHVAIDQYARLVTPDLPEFVTYDSDINADISLEYSQAAFRFGHSQLRDTIDTIDPTGTVVKYALSAAFLNPGAYAHSGAENILRGMSHQLSNEVDEFVTPALQQSLLGQSLDLGAINIARGRDVGMPTLNEVRRQLHDALVAERAADPNTPHHTNLIVDALNPYTSWAEFGSQMQHPESLVNFIAAYAFDGNLAKAQELLDLETGTIASGSGANGWTINDAVSFLNNSTGALPAELAAGAGTFNNIDFWIGGLSELHVFTGQLGTTFNAIFEDQMERLMDGDRFYYLYRLQDALNIDTDLGHAVVTEQFKDIIERTTGILHLNGDVMGYADSYVELDKTHAADLAKPENAGLGIYSGSGNGTAGNGSILTKSNADLGLVDHHYIADFRPDIGENPDGTPALGYNSHEVLSGTDFDDWIDAGNGDDTVYGDKGNDVLDGKAGADHLYGGDGQDVLYGGDIEDFLDGGAGDDIIYAGTSAGALDVVIGGAGNDKLYGEAGIDEIYGGDGDDYIDAGGDTDLAFGDAGNDVMFGGDGPDELRGGLGDDLLSGGSGADVLKGEGGDDIFFGGIGQNALNGDSDELLGDVGFDIAAFSDTSIKLDTAGDLRNQNLVAAGGSAPFNPFSQLWADLEGVIGSKFDDRFNSTAQNPAGTAGIIGDDADNWLVGGGGSDTFGTRTVDETGSTGSAGFDLIVGDSIRLDTLIGSYKSYDEGRLDSNGNAIHSVVKYTAAEGGDAFGLKGGLLADAGLGTQDFAKHYTDLMQSYRNKDFILGNDGGTAGDHDTLVLQGKFSEYTLTSFVYTSANEGDITAYKLVDNGGLVDDGTGNLVARASDGTKLLVGMDFLQFTDTTFDLNLPPISDIQWNANVPNGDGLPGGRNATFAQLSSDAGVGSTTTYEKLSGSNLIQVDSNGRVHTPNTNFNNSLADNSTYNVDIKATSGGASVTETFTILTGSNGNNTLNGAALGHDVVLYGRGGNDTLTGSSKNDSLFGQSGNDTLNGGDGNDLLVGGTGNDTVNGGAGNDTIQWNVSGGYVLNFGSTTTDGRDFIDGGAGTDTFVLTSTVTGILSSNANINEAFDIYTRAAAGTLFGTLNGATEIVITRNNVVVAELANVEELVINTGQGTDTVTIHGNFDPTHLAYNTIHVNDSDGGDTVDISGLSSDHRIVFDTDANGHVVGDLRPQDIVNHDGAGSMTVGSGSGGDSPDEGPASGMNPEIGEDDGQGGDDHGDCPSADASGDQTGTTTTTSGSGTAETGVHLGTADADVLIAVDGDSIISGLGGDDIILGSAGDDTIQAGAGDDIVKAGAGNDLVFGGDGNDTLFGGAGKDMIFGDAGDDRIFADDGNDTVEAGTGNDTVYLGAGDDLVIASQGDGDDVYWGDGGSDTLDYAAITADLTIDLGNGLMERGSVYSSQSGNDTVFGFENVIGGSGNDTIVASAAVNVMDGGAGDDTFVFQSAGAANGDTIKNFQPGDTIDLHMIDANEGQVGQQSFVLFAGNVFTAAGQVIVSHETIGGEEHTIVAGNTTGGPDADFKIDLAGHHNLTTADFNGVH